MSQKFVCIHGHFYQPPRENPWIEKVEYQESAYPYHDWNSRINAECYAPNSVSRIMDAEGKIVGLCNNYSKISFNFGPTLLYWIEQHAPAVYQSILDADRESAEKFSGHGSAIAQVYNHMIMPLANKRDKDTQVKWGIKDFEKRFKRFPEGMWLPETAVDIQTLETLAENNIKFTILGPNQARRIRKIGEKDWLEVKVETMDTQKAYICQLPSEKSINLFFYDGSLASDASFGDALANGEFFAKKLISKFKNGGELGELVSLATDGELYGHHRSHGDMTLAYCLHYIANNQLAQITNFAEFLEKYPPQFEVEIAENTSWSCKHGVERWRDDCGDNTGKPGWKQKWRKPLRDAMDWLRDRLATSFEQEAQQYFKDPWEARNQYINVILNRSSENIDKFLSEQTNKPLNADEKRRAIKLLEMQRQAMLMYTSCGWFFDEISGIETVQVMMYAARAMQLAKETLGLDLEEQFVKMLEQAPSNIAQFGNGAKTYQILVKPVMLDFAKLGAQNMTLTLFPANNSSGILHNCCFKTDITQYESRESGRFRLGIGRIKVSSSITLDEQEFGCAAIWLGDHNVSCGTMPDMPTDRFAEMKHELLGSFDRGQMNEIIQLIPKYFGNAYSLKDMLGDAQRKILSYALKDSIKQARELYDIIFTNNTALLRFMKEIWIAPPRPLQIAAEVSLNMEIIQCLNEPQTDLRSLKRTISDMKSLSVQPEAEFLGYRATQKLGAEFAKLRDKPDSVQRIEKITKLIKAVTELPIKVDFWSAQNVTYNLAQTKYLEMKQQQDDKSKTWVAAFTQLCQLIGIRLEQP